MTHAAKQAAVRAVAAWLHDNVDTEHSDSVCHPGMTRFPRMDKWRPESSCFLKAQAILDLPEVRALWATTPEPDDYTEVSGPPCPLTKQVQL